MQLDLQTTIFGEQRVLGVDLGGRLLKVVDIAVRKPKPVLKDYAAVYLPGETGVGEEAGRLLGLALQNLGIQTKVANITVPLSSVFKVFFTMPRMEEKELREAVMLEARRYLPIDPREVYMDWQYMPLETSETEKARVRVLLIAIPKDTVFQEQRMLHAANLQAGKVEFFGFSLARAARDVDNFSAIVDVSYRPSTLFFVKEGKIYDIRELKFSAGSIDTALAALFQMAPERVEELKEQIGLLEYPEYQDATNVLRNMADTFFGSLSREIESFEQEFKASIERVYFTGGGSALKGFIERAGDQMKQRKALPLNPFTLVEYPPALEEAITARRPILAQALSVAFAGVSF